LKIVQASAAEYDAAGTAAQLFTISKATGAPAKDEELEDLYKRTMATKGARGRQVYDELRLSAPGGLCPLCSQRAVKTLDHYLPKKAFPNLSVVPLNLVPACSDCNKDKGSFQPTTAEEQLLHPYFDLLQTGTWLHAAVSYISTEPVVRFDAAPPQSWSALTGARVVNHFRRLSLRQLYEIYGNKEIQNIRHRVANLFSAGGEKAVNAHLLEEWETRAAVDPNSWQAGTYKALADSPRFCGGEFGTV
jgi:hypothetical protein